MTDMQPYADMKGRPDGQNLCGSHIDHNNSERINRFYTNFVRDTSNEYFYKPTLAVLQLFSLPYLKNFGTSLVQTEWLNMARKRIHI